MEDLERVMGWRIIDAEKICPESWCWKRPLQRVELKATGDQECKLGMLHGLSITTLKSSRVKAGTGVQKMTELRRHKSLMNEGK